MKVQLIKEQWNAIFENPDLSNVDDVKRVVRRLMMAPNGKAGCEQSTSKFNRAKNKLSSTMKLPMIKARMRVGINGPLVHLFNPEPVLDY